MASSSLHFISIHRTVVLRSTTVDCPVSVSLALPLQLRWQNSAGCTTVTLSTTSQRLSAITLPRAAYSGMRSSISIMLLMLLILLQIFGIDLVAADSSCTCQLLERPEISEKAQTARWMVHSLDWGVLATISSRLTANVDVDDRHNDNAARATSSPPIPFGNVYSFVDGTCDKATGIPYLFGTFMDQSFIDSKENPMVSLTLSEASLSSVCTERDGLAACTLGTKYGDPENPVCARLTLTGNLVVLEEDSHEYEFAQRALFERHSTMEGWPSDHNWVIAKIDVQDVWLIDFFGGASIIDPASYFAATPMDANDEADSG
jgi:Pyridoxamine 5'-phosphate oxidase